MVEHIDNNPQSLGSLCERLPIGQHRILFSAWCTLSLILILCLSSTCFASGNSAPAAAPVPGIRLALEVQSPRGAPGTFVTASSPAAYHAGLPVPKGDRVKLDISVAGGGELQHAYIRLDNQLIATLDRAPWSTFIDTSTLAPGNHSLRVLAQQSGAEPASAFQTITFYVASAKPVGATASRSGNFPFWLALLPLGMMHGGSSGSSTSAVGNSDGTTTVTQGSATAQVAGTTTSSPAVLLTSTTTGTPLLLRVGSTPSSVSMPEPGQLASIGIGFVLLALAFFFRVFGVRKVQPPGWGTGRRYPW